MRKRTVLIGLAVVVTTVVAVIVSARLDLELEPVLLGGVALGAAAALVPDGTPLQRLGGLAGGIAVTWFGYAVRAAVLPESPAGRAVSAALVLALLVLLALLASGRIPLWTLLLGSAALALSYESAYAGPADGVSASSTTFVTAVLLAASLGFVAASLTGPGPADAAGPTDRPTAPVADDHMSRLDDMMKETAR